jgi:23S rRNA pseudouridine1911/1915/1917 synthase
VEQETEGTFLYRVPDKFGNIRLDVFLSSRPGALSRSRIQSLIKNGDIKVNNCYSKPSHKLVPGDRVIVSIPHPSPLILQPEAIELEIIHEDDSLIVVNKPAGLVVHPAPGHDTGTLVHGLLKHCKDLSGIGGTIRPGIVHRLDKDTSGLLVVAKNDSAHRFLQRQFKSGVVKKQYLALVHGLVKGNKGKIDLPIGRNPKKRKEMAITPLGEKKALTVWLKKEELASGFSLLLVTIKTGRTHQIRVHLSHIGHPVAGDPIYGPGRNWWKKNPLHKKMAPPPIKRQMLHAEHLGFIHPVKKNYLEFKAPLPDDMLHAIKFLRNLERSQTTFCEIIKQTA